jgi:hypothetical protein
MSEAVKARFYRFDHPTNLKHSSRVLGACQVIHARLINIRSIFFYPTSKTRIILTSMVYFLLAQTPALAQNSQEDLRKIARNPFADEIELQFVEDVTFSQGTYNRNANSLQLQPLFPLSITEKWLLVTRIVTTALAYQPNSEASRGGTTAFGDNTIFFFLTPTDPGKLVWGLGPAVLIPTATSDQLGAGKWGLGPAIALLEEPNWGSIGVLIQNVWSVAGDAKRSPVSQLQLEPMFSYDLPRDWYLLSEPTITAEWTQPTRERWLLPIGGGVGRSFNIGKQAVDSNVAAYWNAFRPTNQPKWQLTLQFTLLFPKHPGSSND